MLVQSIRDNYQQILERIDKAARSKGKTYEDICLVVVTKTHPIERIKVVVNAGARNLGENYVVDAIPKIVHFSEFHELNWHMVGHVQSRKAADVCQYFQFVHSLDNVKLAERYSRHLVERNMKMGFWLEFNVSGEEAKSGWDISDNAKYKNILADIEKIFTLPNLNLIGAMTIPPYSDNPEDSRRFFVKLRKFQKLIKSNFHLDGFNGLSIGMSTDFEVAIQEGSTCVRIGQAILGSRS